MGLHAELTRGVDHGLNPDRVGDLNRHRIDRVGEGRAQRDRPAETPAVILRFPISDLHRSIDRRRLRIEALFEGGEVVENLEQRAGLPFRLGDAIELALVVVAPAHHCENGAVRRHCQEGGLTDSLGVAFRPEPMRDDFFGDALQIEIEGGAHGQIR